VRRSFYRLIICTYVLCPVFFGARAYGLAESTGPNGSNAQAVHALGETGTGINVGFISQGNTRITHEAFADPCGVSHAFNYDFGSDGIDITNHETWMGGVLASRGGTSYPDNIGVAPGVDLHSARVVNDTGSISLPWLEDAIDELVINQNCQVIMTGVALNPTPDGQSQWTMLYDYYAFEYDVVFANAAGNFIYDPCNILITDKILVFGDAYNGITTSGLSVTDPDVYNYVGYKSSEGPTDDGRRKPEVAGPVQNQIIPNGSSDTSWITWTSSGGQTSFSTPHTAGVAALLLGLADDTTEPDDDENEVIKAVIVNSTFPNINDRNNIPTDPADPCNVWHPQRGYGRLDALRAYNLLNSAKVTAGPVISQQKGWAYETMNNNGNRSYYIEGSRNHRLVLTVTWNRKIQKNGSIYTEESSPKFNIDLTIKDPQNADIFSETDTLNNLEKVDLLLAEDGTYEIYLDNTTNKSRGYALAFELLSPIPGDFEPIDYIVDENDLYIIAEQWLLEGPDLETDISPNEKIDYGDFGMFSEYWLQIDPAYYN
jgi:hypothetical protein